MKKIYYFFGLSSVILLIAGCNPEARLDRIAPKIHKEVLTLDSHTDTPIDIFRLNIDIGKSQANNPAGTKVDLPRMDAGGLDAIFFAAYIGQGPRTPAGNAFARQRVTDIIKAIHHAVESNFDRAELALSADDAYRIEKNGKHAIFIGIENGYAIGNDLSAIRSFYDMGVRYITLCHTSNNDICDSSNDSTEHGGLSSFGTEVVKEMNRLGIMVDLSHASDESFYDVLEISTAPVIASHSCTRALCENPRNLTDDMLRALAANSGVIQVTTFTEYVKFPEPNPARDSAIVAIKAKYPRFDEMNKIQMSQYQAERSQLNEIYPPRLATVSDFVDHIDHVVQVAGINYVGIGTDFDGGGELDGLEDVSQMPNITRELVRRGYTKEEIRKIWGGNFMRVLRTAALTAQSAE